MKVYFHTLGCKVNQCEADSIWAEFSLAGKERVDEIEKADIIVISTCAVTNEAERKSRQIASKCFMKNPKAKLLICGCASQKNKAQFEKYNPCAVIGTSGKNRFCRSDVSNLEIETLPTIYQALQKPLKNKTRAFLKIQDGCSNFCSYCIVPFLRGASRSRDLNSIVKEAQELSETSKEIVLTGINISDYKINNKSGLSELLYSLRNISARIKIGSLEENRMTEEILLSMSEMKNFCPHFHLSLQSGSNSVLKRMNRNYTVEEFYDKIKLIRQFFPNAAVTTDLIVGFPEETNEEFEETVEFLKKAEFANIHVFEFSMRSGTAAEKLRPVEGHIVKDRLTKVNVVLKDLVKKYLNKQLNTTLEVLIEKNQNGVSSGKSENNCDVLINEILIVNEIYKIKIESIYNEFLVGIVIK